MMARAAILLGLMCVLGCGNGGPELAKVTGSISLDGKPVPHAIITFFPLFGGSTSYGVTDKTGRYELMFSDVDRGAMLGAFRVKIETKKYTRDELPEGSDPASFAYVEIPKQYRSEDALKAEVKRGANLINFDLTSK
jgi:hypothetical protein